MTTPPVYVFTEISGPAPVTAPISNLGDELILVGRTLHVGDTILIHMDSRVVITDTTTGDTYELPGPNSLVLDPNGIHIYGDFSVTRGSRPDGDGT